MFYNEDAYYIAKYKREWVQVLRSVCGEVIPYKHIDCFHEQVRNYVMGVLNRATSSIDFRRVVEDYAKEWVKVPHNCF